MKLVSSDKDKFVFDLGRREKQLLLVVLARYPLVPAAHQRLSKSAAPVPAEADQRLLEEALAEQRRENQRHLDQLLNDPRRLCDTETGGRLMLTSSEMEWFLQVLNDVRVGSWILLGSPENTLSDFELNESTAPHAWTMEMAGAFQAGLLAALRQSEAA